MRYLLTLLLTFTFACGEESARPRTKQDMNLDQSMVEMDMGMEMGGAEEDMGCNALDCMSDEELQDKLLNLLHPRDHGIYKDHFEFEPEPFEFESDYGFGGHQG